MGGGSGIDEFVFGQVGEGFRTAAVCGDAGGVADGAELVCVVGVEPGADFVFACGGAGGGFGFGDGVSV
jgi:uncharacterized membrane protein